MKLILSFALLAFFLCCVVAEVGKVCKNTSECDDGECCVRAHSFTTYKCKKLKQLDDSCFPNPDWNLKEDGLYRYMCPCADGLECKAEETIVEGDVTTFKSVRCVQKE